MKKITFIGRYAAVFLTVILFSSIIISCKEDEDDIVKPKTITDIIMQNSEFSILKEIVVANSLGDDLRSENITVFAPNDAAFKLSNITSDTVNAMLPDSARAFVLKHIIKTNLSYQNLKDKPGNFNTVFADNIVLVEKSKTSDSTLVINKVANIITRDVNAANGRIQVVNRPLVMIK